MENKRETARNLGFIGIIFLSMVILVPLMLNFYYDFFTDKNFVDFVEIVGYTSVTAILCLIISIIFISASIILYIIDKRNKKMN